MPNPPDRWWDYEPHGERIPETPFIAFKTPLSSNYFRSGDLKHSRNYDIWTPEALLRAIPNLGAVIDLTATDRYYKGSSLEYVFHFKIKVPGRMVPPEELVNKFFENVEEAMHSKPGRLIGVHCTHGVNRTGYFLCRYLIDRMNWPMEKAIYETGQSRGYGIERDCFIDELKRRDSKKKSKKEKPGECEKIKLNGSDIPKGNTAILLISNNNDTRPPTDKESNNFMSSIFNKNLSIFRSDKEGSKLIKILDSKFVDDSKSCFTIETEDETSFKELRKVAPSINSNALLLSSNEFSATKKQSLWILRIPSYIAETKSSRKLIQLFYEVYGLHGGFTICGETPLSGNYESHNLISVFFDKNEEIDKFVERNSQRSNDKGKFIIPLLGFQTVWTRIQPME